MSHQPFEQWIFTVGELSSAEREKLNQHLEHCQHCRSLASAMADVENMFGDVAMIAPPAGFVERWTSRAKQANMLALEKRYQWQSLIMLVAVSNGIVFFLAGMFFILNRLFSSPADLLITILNRIFAYYASLQAVQLVTWTLLKVLFDMIPPIGWGVLLGSGMTGLIFWLILVRKLVYSPRRVRI